MTRIISISLISIFAIFASSSASQDKELPTLMERVAHWQYPDSQMNGATMSDVPTVNSKGERTVSSIQCKTVLSTEDPVAKVIQYYENKLAHRIKAENENADTARSVIVHSDSEDRDLVIHIITVIESASTTTLVISRGGSAAKTHIAWTQYTQL